MGLQVHLLELSTELTNFSSCDPIIIIFIPGFNDSDDSLVSSGGGLPAVKKKLELVLRRFKKVTRR